MLPVASGAATVKLSDTELEAFPMKVAEVGPLSLL
jgi:hypothetical protein